MQLRASKFWGTNSFFLYLLDPSYLLKDLCFWNIIFEFIAVNQPAQVKVLLYPGQISKKDIENRTPIIDNPPVFLLLKAGATQWKGELIIELEIHFQ